MIRHVDFFWFAED